MDYNDYYQRHQQYVQTNVPGEGRTVADPDLQWGQPPLFQYKLIYITYIILHLFIL